MRKFLREYFSFSRSELRVVVILSVLILASLLVRLIFPIPDFQNYKLTAEDNMAIDSFIQSLEKITYEKEKKYAKYKESEPLPAARNFNPNDVTASELESMGFPDFVGKNLLAYRNAGGKFNAKSDFKKLYGLTDSIYIQWEEYLEIPPQKERDTTRSLSFSKPIIDLNSADSSNLLIINGVGPYFAGKIMQYRKRLGGYIRFDQLMEIRGMDSIRLENIKKQVIIDTLYIVKININKANLKDLKLHPYISARLAESIMEYRKFAGSIKNVNELLENHIITELELAKLKSYITVGEYLKSDQQ
jgi:competence protein ComEA